MDVDARVPLNRYATFLALAAAGCAADLWSKHWMFTQDDLRSGQVRWIWPEHFGFQLSLNQGALFGMGQGRTFLFAAFALAAGIAIPYTLFFRGAARDLRLTVTLGSVMGGVLGNLFDRLGGHGMDWSQFATGAEGRIYAVRDFILFAWQWSEDPEERIVWPNFNIADMLLVGGACALFLLTLTSSAVHHDAAERVLPDEAPTA
ncbi:MAG: signal peptidase II [Planctomycetales bacterium]|nr:signal peptidase II [Planctomycetales bacterium]